MYIYMCIYIYIYIYNRTKTGGPELVKQQVFPTLFGSGLFQGNLSSREFYRFT